MRVLGVERLQNQVQCMDIVDGCLSALYHLKIVQSTGSTGDLLLFQPISAPPVEAARADYWRTLQSRPPSLIVMSNWHFNGERDFHKIDTWPEFARFLAENYTQVEQRDFPAPDVIAASPGGNPPWPAYRLYARRASAIVDAAAALPRVATAQ